MKFTEYPQGTPCWVDLGSSDLAASVAFYSGLFGWRAEASPDPQYGGYTMFHIGDDAVAAAAPLMAPGQPVAWSTYFAVDDADATVAAAQANGGNVLAPAMTVGDQGRMAILSDPTGGVFGIWQKIGFAGAQLANEPNTWSWNELGTSDVAAAAAFYRAVLGVEVEPTEMGGVAYNLIKVGGKAVGGIFDTGGAAPYWAIYFTVADVEATIARVEALGGKLVQPPQETEGVGRYATVQDPQGAAFGIIK